MYSHDGLHDSLTQLAAPTLLYEELRRELARANRESRRVSIIRFVLTPSYPGSNNAEPISYSRYEEEVLCFAQTLTRLSRDEEVCARMGELEFICIIHGIEIAAQSFIERITRSYRPDLIERNEAILANPLRLVTSSLVSHPHETALELLNRLDSEPSSLS